MALFNFALSFIPINNIHVTKATINTAGKSIIPPAPGPWAVSYTHLTLPTNREV